MTGGRCSFWGCLRQGGWSGPGSRSLRPQPLTSSSCRPTGSPCGRCGLSCVEVARGAGMPAVTPVALRAAALPPCSVESGVEPIENQIRVTPSSLRRQLRLGAGPDPGGRHRPSASIVGLLLLLCCADRTLRGSFEATQATGKILGFILFKSYKRINLTNPKWQLAGSAVPALVDSQSWPLGASWGPALVEGGSPGLWSRCRGRSVDTVRPTAAPQLCPRPVRRPSLRAGFWAGSPCRLSARALGSVC